MQLATAAAVWLHRAARLTDTPLPPFISASLEATHAAYHACGDLLLGAAAARRAAVLFATHNEASVVWAAQRMQALGLPPDGGCR